NVSGGNSLIGARLDDLGILPEMTKKNKQKPVTTLAGHQFKGAIAAAVSTFQQIAQAPSDSVEDIHRKESAYETARHALSQIKTIAEVWTSTSFGNEVRDKDAYERLLHLAESDSANWPKANELPWLDKAKAMSQERNFFHWELEFPDVYFDRNGQGLPNPGFQASVGNPPWGGALDRTILGFLDAMYEDVNDYESYQYFSQTSVQNLADGGKHSFIVPNTYVLNVLANPLRRWMFDKGAFNLLVDCSDVQLFDDPSVRCIIYVYTKGITNNGIVIHKLATTLDNSMTVNNWCLVKRSEIADGRPWAYLLRDARNVPDLVSRIEKVSIPLGTISKSKQGYIPYRLTTLARRFGEKEAKRIKNSRAWHSRSKLDVTYLPELQGGDVSRFEIDWSGVWVSYGEWVSSYVELEYFTTPRLLFREITSEPPNRLLATYVAETFVHNPSVLNACFLQTEYSHLYCLTLVNSSLLSEYFYRTSSKSDKGLFPKVLVEDVRRLPIRRMNFTMPRVEREQLMAEAKRLFRQYLQSKDWNSILLFVAERLPHKLDGTPDTELEQSDVIHDLLAFLAEKMIRLHKDKQAEIEGFLIWLKSYLAINIEDLKNKTRVKEYYKAEVAWEGLLNALEQNRRTIQLAKGIDITRREPREVIRSEFDTSIAKLTPILEVIELTDKLIGQVVYRLYGLTEEEIAVVERQPIQIS
ncbi:MAG: TaqI-like C-terminal specificity domain-containing protein, partial [Promethearchaeati archaeon]